MQTDLDTIGGVGFEGFPYKTGGKFYSVGSS